MKNPNPVKCITRLAAILATAAATLTTQAQDLVFAEHWDVNHSTDGTYRTNFTASGVSLVDLYYDYSLAGVPLSPNSTNSVTRALKMAVNLASGGVFPVGVSVSPVGFGITEDFDMRFDMWWNFNGPFTAGGSGSTQIAGAGYGTAGTNAQVAGVADSIYIGGSTDGNTASDFRVYSSAHAISYQGGSYQIGSSGIDAAILGDPASGYVYAGTGGSRDSDNIYFQTNFPAVQCPTNQFVLFPQQTNSNGTLPGQPGFVKAGTLAFKWRDVSLRKVGNIITYKIDDVLVATVNVADAGALGGTNILFNMYDINAGNSTDPNRTNLIFTLIDNVRITSFTNVVTVTNTVKEAAEAGPTSGEFKITRTAAGNPLTVYYTMSGTASNGVDYLDILGGALSGQVTFDAAATSTNITIVPVDDAEAELVEQAVLSIVLGNDYTGAGSASVTIADNEPATLNITNISSQMFERTNDYASFRLSRLGDTNTTFTVNLGFSGTATEGADYYTNATATFDLGAQATNFSIYPIADAAYEGVETVTVSIAAASAGEYVVGTPNSAAITLVDANTAPETVLFSDNFDTDSTANWNVIYRAIDGEPFANDLLDAAYDFNFTYTSFGIPEAPHGGGNGLFFKLNKTNASAAVFNAYPIGQSFSGNFALRFDMFLSVPQPSSSATEYALAGINHAGTRTNAWVSGGSGATAVFDGLFCLIETDNGSTPNYALYSAPNVSGNPTLRASQTGTAMAGAFKQNPWAVAGAPGNVNSSGTFATPIWADVEVSQIGRIISLRINNSTVLSYSNATSAVSGNIMVGYEDAFNSLSPAQSYVIIDNVRVVSLPGLSITSIVDLGASTQIDFSYALNDVPASFQVQSASIVTGPYAAATATIVQLTPGNYRATVTKSGGVQFYRIRHL